MNLENYKVQELSLEETQETQGGFPLLAVGLGILVGLGLYLIFTHD